MSKMEKRKINNLITKKCVDEAVVRLMSYRSAVYAGMCSDGLCFDDMPEKIQRHFLQMEYRDIVRPLILRDHKTGFTAQKMANMYRLTYRQVRYYTGRMEEFGIITAKKVGSNVIYQIK